MMKLAPQEHQYHNLLDDDHANEMLEGEAAGLAARVGDLEVKCARQAEELLCLRSTLADALRRINSLEGRPAPSTSTHRNGAYAGSPSSSAREVRMRQSTYRETAKRTSSYNSTTSSLPHRRGPQHQSTGSLQSDSPASSSSLSPAPSPAPQATAQPYRYLSRNNSTSSNHSVIAAGGNNLTKRWNSAGDFNAQGLTSPNRFTTAKSLLNLYSKPSQNGPILKHGTQSCQFNEQEGSMRLYLRGRPVVLYGPGEDSQRMDPAKVAPPPHSKLNLEWVYGYRGKDCRSNLYLLPTGEIVYFVAAVVVMLNVEEQCQRHYTQHTDDVKCLAVHPNKMVIASGQCKGRGDAMPHVRVWNSVSLATLAVIGSGQMERSVACVSFSRADGGAMLACVHEGTAEHTISVWEWQRTDKGHCVAETKCSVDTVVFAEFHPLERNQIVTCGKNHIAFWTIDQSNVLYKRMGVFDSRDKPKYVTCIGFNRNGDVLSGDSSGNVAMWPRGTNTISKVVKGVHQGPVFSLLSLKDGTIVTAGGKDGRLLTFDSNMNPLGRQTQIEGHYGGVRVVAEGRGSQLFIGTTRNCILHGDIQLGFTPAVLGHVEELWGLAVHPTLPQFVTAGWDRLLQLWDAMSHSTVWSKDIEERAQCCAWSLDGAVLAVGCLSGKWMLFDPTTREMVAHFQDGTEPIQTIQFSPDNRMVALGSRDNNVYVYHIDRDSGRFSRQGKCLGHSSYITHLDWSQDNQYIRSNSGDYELLFWNASTCRQVTSPMSLRDCEWATNCCPITFQTIGVWPENADGTDINSCTRSNDSKLLATGDDFGKVKVFSYPATQPKSLFHQYGGHSSHVTSVRFLSDDVRLISTGGLDTSVMQWLIQ